MEKKYEILENDTIQVNGHKLLRIRALRNFWTVEKGQLGGYVESEENLSHNGNAWVFGDARVFGKIMLRGQARVGHTKDFQAFGGLGREFFNLTAYRTIGGIELSTNEFQGSIEEFRKWSKKTYKNYPKLKRSFELILEEIKVWFDLND